MPNSPSRPFSLILGFGLALTAGATAVTGVTLAHQLPARTMAHVKIVSDSNTIGAFKPKTITVHKGAHIVFKNSSDAIHTVTADKHKAFDSKDISMGASWTYTAKHVGTFKYHCKYHVGMHGTIVVRP
ncbi:MAG: cupredoxin domain-containing protein [Chloroflexota bacterium]